MDCDVDGALGVAAVQAAAPSSSESMSTHCVSSSKVHVQIMRIPAGQPNRHDTHVVPPAGRNDVPSVHDGKGTDKISGANVVATEVVESEIWPGVTGVALGTHVGEPEEGEVGPEVVGAEVAGAEATGCEVVGAEVVGVEVVGVEVVGVEVVGAVVVGLAVVGSRVGGAAGQPARLQVAGHAQETASPCSLCEQ